MAEERTLSTLLVRLVGEDLRAAYSLSEIAQLYAALPHVVVVGHAHWLEPGAVECRKLVLCGILQTDFGEFPVHALG